MRFSIHREGPRCSDKGHPIRPNDGGACGTILGRTGDVPDERGPPTIDGVPAGDAARVYQCGLRRGPGSNSPIGPGSALVLSQRMAPGGGDPTSVSGRQYIGATHHPKVVPDRDVSLLSLP